MGSEFIIPPHVCTAAAGSGAAVPHVGGPGGGVPGPAGPHRLTVPARHRRNLLHSRGSDGNNSFGGLDFDRRAAPLPPEVTARRRAWAALEATLQSRLDPIDWATYELHLAANVAGFGVRSGVLLGALLQLAPPSREVRAVLRCRTLRQTFSCWQGRPIACMCPHLSPGSVAPVCIGGSQRPPSQWLRRRPSGACICRRTPKHPISTQAPPCPHPGVPALRLRVNPSSPWRWRLMPTSWRSRRLLSVSPICPSPRPALRRQRCGEARRRPWGPTPQVNRALRLSHPARGGGWSFSEAATARGVHRFCLCARLWVRHARALSA